MISIESAESYLKKRFVPERKRVIKTLRDIKDDIQGETKTKTAANVLYNSVSIVYGFVLITGALSTRNPFLLKTGFYIGESSVVIKACHRRISNKYLLKKLTDAVTRLNEHKTSSLQMMELMYSVNEKIDLVEWLQRKITLIQPAIEDRKMKFEKNLPLLNKIGSIIGESLPHEEQASRIIRLCEIGKSFENALFVAIIGNIESLIRNLDNLANYNKGELCTHARVIDLMLEDLQWELDMYEDLFPI